MPDSSTIPLSIFCSVLRHPPRSPLFPYTTLFRSQLCLSHNWLETRCLLQLELLLLFSLQHSLRCQSNFEDASDRSEEHTSELQSRGHLVCRLLLEKKKVQLLLL